MAAKFELVSKFQPAGDQPQAIAKLVQGFREGKQGQVLLGATGTGKSLAWEEPVLVRSLCPDGTSEMRVAPIGAIIDAAFASPSPPDRGAGETEIAVPPHRIEVLSFNPTTCASEWRPVTAFTRHTAPKQMFRVRTECGREVVVTGDHNFMSLRAGALVLSRTADLTADDYLPLPPGFALPERGPETIDLLDLFGDADRLEVFSPSAFSWIVEQVGWNRVRAAMLPHYSQPHNKRLAILHRNAWQGIPIPVFRNLLAVLNLEVPADVPVSIRGHATPKGGCVLPRHLPVTQELLTVLGLMLAEGHCAEDRYAVFASHEAPVRAEFFRCATALRLPVLTRPSSDVQISSLLWNTLFRRLVGAKSREKHLPPFWPSLDRSQLGTLLRAYVEGDGGIEKPMVTATTASPQLASELGYALFAFGIWGRLHKVWKRATNSDHAGDWYHTITISGQGDLSRFAEGIGFLTERKNRSLASLRGRPENTNVDVVPLDGPAFRTLRQALSQTQQLLAHSIGMSRSHVRLLEHGARRPSRSCLARCVRSWEVQQAPSPEAVAVLDRARHLLNARWARVEAVEPVEHSHPKVYDFTVADNETFLAGHGGLFVHNTFTASCVIEQIQKPTLVLAHNKTLAAQLYKEFRAFFPRNAVHYFVSYYDYYQPEAYIPQRDIYIEKDALVNENIDRLRLAATSALVSREDVLIVASVSCIYGLGSPSDYKRMMVRLVKGETVQRDDLLLRLVDILYERNDVAFTRGKFRVRGDVIEVWPASEEFGLRIELFGDEVDALAIINPTSGETLRALDELYVYPAKHFVTPEERIKQAVAGIQQELEDRLKVLNNEGKLLEAQRLAARTRYDVEMLQSVGHCPGVENYARWFSGRNPGEPPYTLLDFFPDDFLMIVDESHATLPQVRGMFAGDHARKLTLVEHGFRLPSAMDNRPLRFDEWEKRVKQGLFMSATPGPYELEKTGGEVVEQVIRPTGLVDPLIHVKPARGQVPDLVAEIEKRAAVQERVLVTTLTKRLAEDLSGYLREAGLRTKWLHSELDAIERMQVLRELREGAFDVLVGVNLLREGLDLPEVSLVAILDADKEGFLRSGTSLIQTIGRAARNVNAEVILYADRVTDSMQRAMDETARRRALQLKYNEEHNITPRTVVAAIDRGIEDEIAAHKMAQAAAGHVGDDYATQEYLEELHGEMLAAAANLQFERAAELRDRIAQLKGQPSTAPQPQGKKPRGRRGR